MKSKTLILFFLLLQIYTSSLLGQEKEVVEINLDTSATLHWGQVSIPMTTTLNKGIKGKFTSFQSLPRNFVPIDELIGSTRERIFLYQNNKQIYTDIKVLTLSFTTPYSYVEKLIKEGVPIKEAQDRGRVNEFTLKLTSNDLKQLPERHIQEIIDKVMHQTLLYININDGLFFGFANIIDNNAPYEAPSMVYHRPLVLFDFQLLEPLKGSTILRIDTTTNNRLFDFYKNDGQTKIIHIPNFKTANGTVDEKNEHDLEKILALPSSYPTTEMLTLPEYIDFTPKNLQLRLGQLIANPDGDNIPLAVFRTNNGKLSLWQDKTQLTIKQFRLTIFDQENKAKTVWVKNLKNEKWQSYFDALTYENAIYIDKIIMEKGKQKYVLGQPFLFKIGKAHLKW